MQSNSAKQDFNQQQNNHTSEAVYSTYQTVPPLYAPYPQQGFTGTEKSTASQAPVQQQYRTALVPVYRNISSTGIQIPVTTSLRIFLLLSGFLYSLWGITGASIDVAVIINSYSTYYYGFWSGFLFIVVGIVMMTAGLRTTTPLARLIRLYLLTLFPCSIGLAFMTINLARSRPCDSTTYLYCDDDLARDLKIGHIVVSSLAALHTLFNIFYVNKEYNRAVKQSYPTILNS